MIGTLNDVLEAEERGVMNFTVDGRCSGCGQCCSDFLPLSKEEINRIRRYIKAHDIKEKHNNVLMQGFDMTCPFRDEVNRVCTIYRIRPEICREFKCDYDPARIDTTKKLFHQRNHFISMRETFFGDTLARRLARANAKEE